MQKILILMECDECGAEWEQGVDDGRDCAECGELGHKMVTVWTMGRMRVLLGERRVEASRLLTAFMACTVGGEGFAQAVLERAVRLGRIERENGEVWNRTWNNGGGGAR